MHSNDRGCSSPVKLLGLAAFLCLSGRLVPMSTAFLVPTTTRQPPVVSAAFRTRPTATTVLFVKEATPPITSDKNGVRVNSNNNNNNNDSSEDNDDMIVVPQPPEYPPPSIILTGDLELDYQELQQQNNETAFRMQVLEDRVLKLQNELEKKERELHRRQQEWGIEKDSLVGKIQEFASLWQGKDTNEEEEAYERERLEREVELLQTQMNQAMNALKLEQRAAAEVKQRLEDVQDELEFQQMEFEKAKQGLQQTVEQEKQKLAEIKGAWEEDKKRFVSVKDSIQKQLNEESKRLLRAQQEWSKNQEDYEKQEKSLKEQLANQKELLKQRTAELAAERAQSIKETSELKDSLEQEKKKLSEVERTLEQERKRFQKAQADLEKKIENEQAMVASLSDRLEREKQRFDQERANLETRIEVEQQRLSEVEERLALEQQNFAQREAKMQEQLEDEIRVRKLKKRQMNERYDAIRKEMTALWEGSKREARKERNALQAKYEKQLSTVTASLTDLEKNYNNVRAVNEELKLRLDDMTRLKEKSEAEMVSMERRFMQTLAQRNAEITDLTNNVTRLKTTVQEQEKLLVQYQSSYRQLLGLSFKLTGKRLKNTSTRVSRWITRRPKDD